MEEANKILETEEQKIKEQMDDILNPKKQGKTFRAKLSKYSKPTCNVILGTFMSLISGLVAPMFGLLIMKIIAAITLAQNNGENVIDAIWIWIVCMVIGSVLIFFGKGLSVTLFGKVGQNIVLGVR